MSKTIKRVLSARIDENIIDRLNYFCGVLEVSQAEFIAMALENKCNEVEHLRIGGGIVEMTNPQIMNYTEDEAKEITKILSETANKLTTINPGLDFGLHEIAAFATQRFFKDSQQQQRKFSANLYNDLENTKKGE